MEEIAGGAAVLVNSTPQDCVRGVKEAITSSEELRKLGFHASKRFSRDRFTEEVKSYYSSVAVEGVGV